MTHVFERGYDGVSMSYVDGVPVDDFWDFDAKQYATDAFELWNEQEEDQKADWRFQCGTSLIGVEEVAV